jgi:photosynthetic reaction center cytochrome c subunit
VNCATCHQGAYQPLLGANMLADYPNLSRLAPAEEPAAAMEATTEMESASLDNSSTSGEAH